MTYPARLIVTIILLSGIRLMGADPTPPPGSRPKEDSNESRPYLYCEVPGFQILSPFAEAQTKEYARALQWQRALLSLVIPEAFQARYDAPQAIFLDNQPSHSSKRLKAARTALQNNLPGGDRVENIQNLIRARSEGPATLVKGQTQSAPRDLILQSVAAARGEGEKPISSDDALIRTRVLHAASADSAVFYGNLEGFDNWKFNIAEKDNPALRAAFPTSAFYEHLRPRLPVWLEEQMGGRGKSSFFLLRAFEPGALRITPISFAILPVPGLTIEGAFADPAAGEPIAVANARYGFMQVFVTWALLEDQPARADAFWRFVARASMEPVTEEVFTASFGPDGWQNLQRYWKEHTSKFRSPADRMADCVFPVPKKLAVAEALVRPATRAESTRIRGEYEWRVAREFSIGDPTLGQQGLDQAGVRLRKAYDDGERDPRFLAVLALWECDTGKRTDARLHLEQAAAAKVVRPSVYFELARLRLAEERAKLPTPDGKLDGEQTRRVLEPLEVALTQHPALDEVYQLLTEVWARSAVTPSRENLAALAEGVRLFPRDPILAYKVGMLHVREGAAKEAADIAAQGLRFAASPDIRARLLKLQETARPVPTAEVPRS